MNTNTNGNTRDPRETLQRVSEQPADTNLSRSTYSSTDEATNSEELANTKNSWNRILAHVAAATPNSPPFEIKKRDGLITLTKNWRDKGRSAVWTKSYRPKVAGGVERDLSYLCTWEFKQLFLAKEKNVKGCVVLLTSNYVDEDSQLHSVDLDPKSRQGSRLEFRTEDAGPTLDVWEKMKPRVHGRPQAHPFVEQRNYLELVRGIFLALRDFHDKGFIHCDLHPRNIALPVQTTYPMTSDRRDEYLVVKPRWDEIRVIDLDFSASKWATPSIPLPHSLPKGDPKVPVMSDHLRLRLLAIQDWLNLQGKQSYFWDANFWATDKHGEYLKCFTTLDWREDLYQLGYWLAEIRDKWGGRDHVDITGDPRKQLTEELKKQQTAVNAFIKSFPERLMNWGGIEQVMWDQENWNSIVPAPGQLPHAGYIRELDSLLRLDILNEVQKELVLYRCDHDSDYEPKKQAFPSEASTSVDQDKPPQSQTKPDGARVISQPDLETSIRFDRQPVRREPTQRSWKKTVGMGVLVLVLAVGTIQKWGISPQQPAKSDEVPTDVDRLFPLLTKVGSQSPERSVDLKADKSSYAVGEEFHFTIKSPIAGYLSLLSADAGDSRPQVIFENFQVASGKAFDYPRQNLLPLQATAPLGTVRFIAVATPNQIDWSGILKSGVRETNLETFAASSELKIEVTERSEGSWNTTVVNMDGIESRNLVACVFRIDGKVAKHYYPSSAEPNARKQECDLAQKQFFKKRAQELNAPFVDTPIHFVLETDLDKQ